MHGGLERFAIVRDKAGSSPGKGPVIGFDVTRLFLGPLSRSPRGIDRIDLALAHHLFADDTSPHLGILPTPWGVRTFDAARIRRGLDHLDALWAESVTAEADPQWRNVSGWLRGETPSQAAAKRGGHFAKAARLARELGATGFAFGKAVRMVLPRGAVYLNVGQIGLAVPAFHAWLHHRPDVTAVHMLHDVIPLDHPELVEPPSRAHHLRMVKTAARQADGLIVTTEHARERIWAELARHRSAVRHPLVRTLVRGLPLPRAFTHPRASDPALADVRYFVACGSIEPRKNHALLFEVWRRLRAKFGAATPRLVLVGSPGWQSEVILRPLEQDRELGALVHHFAGLSSPALARLMLGAAAVLCPSRAEGFGLPLLEAGALGVPVIASDIPSHREVARKGTILISCDEPERWTEAVCAHHAGGSRQTPPIADDCSERAYCLDILAFLAECASHRIAARA
jgi:glycosyltransferase involved in cell wall biosynthesis